MQPVSGLAAGSIGQRAEVRVQRSEDRVQKSEVGSQRTEVNGQAASGLVGGVGGVIFLGGGAVVSAKCIIFVGWIWILSALFDGYGLCRLCLMDLCLMCFIK